MSSAPESPAGQTRKPWILIKWGGSLITDKRRPGHARADVIDRLCGELAAALKDTRLNGYQVILGHGSGSFGHAEAKKLGLSGQGSPKLTPERLADAMAVRVKAAELHHMVCASLVSHGVPAWSWAPSVALTAQDGSPAGGSLDGLLRAAQGDFLPVTYGDVLVDTTLGASISSTEKVMDFLIAEMAKQDLRPARLLWMGETSGIYDRDGQTIPQVNESNLNEVEEMIDAPAGIDVTGGMLLRLRTAWDLARRGVPSWILDGTVPGLFEAALKGEDVPGTKVGLDASFRTGQA